MERLVIHASKCLAVVMVATGLAACTADSSDEPVANNGGAPQEMQFRAVVSPLSRATGTYDDTTYPVSTLYLTAFHIDESNSRQYYFIDKTLDYADGVWKATNWYWPLQGKMSFMSYWCPGFSRQPSFDTMEDANGNKMPRMTVDATTLDGRTDFIYLSQTDNCPHSATDSLLFTHGLTWITISLRAEALADNGVDVSTSRTNELISHLKVHKVTIEDCARRGIATVVPGNGIIWKTYDDSGSGDPVSFVRDQVYYNDGTSATGASHYTWKECPDATALDITTVLPITSTSQQLGEYTTDSGAPYIGKGLLIVPQSKTAITVNYTVTDINGIDFHKVERFELRDNTESWMPGYSYNYDIVFRNYSEIGANFDVIPTWSGVFVNSGNYCYEDGVLGVLHSDRNPGCGLQLQLEPMHNGGSGTGDDMDYSEGPTVF